jgi:hypothetical protein
LMITRSCSGRSFMVSLLIGSSMGTFAAAGSARLAENARIRLLGSGGDFGTHPRRVLIIGAEEAIFKPPRDKS